MIALTRMAAKLSRALLSTQQVVDLLDGGEDADFELDELGFEEVELDDELEDEHTVYSNSIMLYIITLDKYYDLC